MELFLRELEKALASATEEERAAITSTIRTLVENAKALWSIEGVPSMISLLGDAIGDDHLDSRRTAVEYLAELRDSGVRILPELATELLESPFACQVLDDAVLPVLAASAWLRRQTQTQAETASRRDKARIMLKCASIDPKSVVSNEHDAQELGQCLAALRLWASRIEPPSTGGRPAIDATAPIAAMAKAGWPNNRIARLLGVTDRTVRRLRNGR